MYLQPIIKRVFLLYATLSLNISTVCILLFNANGAYILGHLVCTNFGVTGFLCENGCTLLLHVLLTPVWPRRNYVLIFFTFKYLFTCKSCLIFEVFSTFKSLSSCLFSGYYYTSGWSVRLKLPPCLLHTISEACYIIRPWGNSRGENWRCSYIQTWRLQQSSGHYMFGVWCNTGWCSTYNGCNAMGRMPYGTDATWFYLPVLLVVNAAGGMVDSTEVIIFFLVAYLGAPKAGFNPRENNRLRFFAISVPIFWLSR